MSSPELRLRTLLYRYFFYGWLFRDAQRGNDFERSAAWRHNREQARWLPTYLRRWSLLMLVWFVAALVTELALQWPGVSALLYVPSVVAVPYLTVTLVAWWWLSRWSMR